MVNHTRKSEPTIDRKIRPGDVAIDQAQGSWVYVVDYAAAEVGYWNEENGADLLGDYAGNWLCGATRADQVFSVVYLSGNGVKSAPGKTYDFPESRLARLPVEEANLDLERPQATVLESFITELLEETKRKDWQVQKDGDTLDDRLENGLDAWFQDLLDTILQRRFDLEDVLESADDRAEERFQDARERWEEAMGRQDSDGQDDAADGGQNADDSSIDSDDEAKTDADEDDELGDFDPNA